MGTQCRKLEVQLIGHVDDVIGLGCSHDPHVVHRPGVEPLVGKKDRMREGIACVGIDSEDRGFSGGHMVRVRGGDAGPIALR